jgi:hypothetical protein
VSSAITIVTSVFPLRTGKTYTLKPDGVLKGYPVATIMEARAVTVEVETAAEMVKVLRVTTESRNQAIILSACNNDDAVGQQFRLVTEGALAEILGHDVGEEGVYRIKGQRMAARVKRGMHASNWILIDADNPEGISEQSKALTLGERLERLAVVLPGISTCERIEYRSSSARVINGSGEPGGPTHALIRVSDPSKIDTMREYLKVATVNAGLSFLTPRRSRKEPDKVVGQEHRTLIDLSVFLSGRIVFNAMPSVSKAPGYRVADAGVRIVNPDGGVLDIDDIELPGKEEVSRYERKTNTRIKFSRREDGSHGSLFCVDAGTLTWETEIERRGEVRTLAEWMGEIAPNNKLRCETPFRASSSEAAFIAKHKNGDVFLFDVGTNTKYVLRESAQSAFKDDVDPCGSFDADDDDEADRPSSKADTTAVESEDDSPDEVDEYLIAQKMPDIDPRAFYGPLREIVEAATKNSEATKVGVGLQVIAQVSMCLRPFYIDLGDARLPLNFFALQIGRSGLGRKGTSAAFADQHLAPMIRAVAEDVRSLTLVAAADVNEQAAAQHAVQEAEDRIDWVQALGIDDLMQVDTEFEALQEEQATAQANVGAWRTKIAAKTYAPTTHDNYERKITECEAKIAGLKDRLADLSAKRSRVEAVIKDPDGQLAAAEKTYADLAAAFRARPAPAPPEKWQTVFGALADPPVTLSGVSSGEGLIFAIRDPRRGCGEDKERDDPGVAEKRLLINMSEFGSVLALVRRFGSTLSSVLRDLYDCKRVETGAKVSPVRCTEPFVSVSASITPRELTGLLFDEKDIAASADNGFGNRFFYAFVARNKLVAHPARTENRDALTRTIAENVRKVYAELKPLRGFLSTPIEFTPEARDLYEREIYKPVDGLQAASPNADRLFGRLTAHLRKIAAILAVIAGESRVSVGALEAAVAWVEYGAATVNVIASTVEDRRRMKRLGANGEAILRALKDLKADVKAVSQREVKRKTNLDAKRFKSAVAWLLSKAPSPIALVEAEYRSGKGGAQKRSMLELTPQPASGDDDAKI